MHPETRDGEIFLTNQRRDWKPSFLILMWRTTLDGEDPVFDTEDPWEAISFPSKRRGETSYSREGEILPYYYPVFVLESDIPSELLAEIKERELGRTYPGL